jgi:hypothetical protein
VARIREVQVSGSLPASPLPVITSDDTEKPGLELERAGGVADIGLGRTRITGRPAFWRASMNGASIAAPSICELLQLG